MLELAKVATDFGLSGLLIFLIWKFASKWTPKFLSAQERQATAMSDLASAVREGRDEQRDLVLAVRALASKIDDQRESFEELDRHVRGQRAQGVVAR